MTTIKIDLQNEQAKQLVDLAARMGIKSEDLIRLKVLELLRARTERAVEVEPHPPETRKNGMEMMRKLQEMLPPGFKPPTDEEVEQMLHERRMRKYG